MKRWEYLELTARNASLEAGDVEDRVTQLNALGAEGWEVVAAQRIDEVSQERSFGETLLTSTPGLLYLLKREVAA